MEELNSKLFLKNCYIMTENERLRKKAEVLNKENKALKNEIKRRLLAQDKNSPRPNNNIPDLNFSSSSNSNAND